MLSAFPGRSFGDAGGFGDVQITPVVIRRTRTKSPRAGEFGDSAGFGDAGGFDYELRPVLRRTRIAGPSALAQLR